jgi:hypothetical protein
MSKGTTAFLAAASSIVQDAHRINGDATVPHLNDPKRQMTGWSHDALFESLRDSTQAARLVRMCLRMSSSAMSPSRSDSLGDALMLQRCSEHAKNHGLAIAGRSRS